MGKTTQSYFCRNLRIRPQLQRRKREIRPQLQVINKTSYVIITYAYRMYTKLPRLTLGHNDRHSTLCTEVSMIHSFSYLHNRELSTGTHSICYIQGLLIARSNIYSLSEYISLNVRFDAINKMRTLDKYLLKDVAGNDQTLRHSFFPQIHSQLCSKQQLQFFIVFWDLHWLKYNYKEYENLRHD